MKYFTIDELCHSDTAILRHISNSPDSESERNLVSLIENVLDPLRESFGKPIYVNSGYRSKTLNTIVGGSITSQHLTGQAADITARVKRDNRNLFDLLKRQGNFDQLIWEKGSNLYPDWIHVSYSTINNRHQILYL